MFDFAIFFEIPKNAHIMRFFGVFVVREGVQCAFFGNRFF